MAVQRPPSGVANEALRALRRVRRWQLWTLPEPLRTYALGVEALTLCAIGLAILSASINPRDWAVGATLLACGVVAVESSHAVKETHGEVVRDLQPVWFLAIAVAAPPLFALLAPFPIMAYKLARLPRLIPYRRVLSTCTLSLGYGCASVVFHAIPASIAGAAPGSGRHALTWAGSIAVCGVVGWSINYGLVVTGIRLYGHSERPRDSTTARSSISFDVLEAGLSISLALMVAGLITINPVLTPVALPAMLLCKRSVMRYQLVAQTRLDAQTGLLNADTWWHEAEAELTRAVRQHAPLAVAIVDIDHFQDVRAIADQSLRDHVLRDVADMLMSQMPGNDLIGRLGGDEFIILLTGTNATQALRITERIRDHIAAEPVTIESGDQAGYVLRLTVSIGIALLSGSRQTLAELTTAAGSALGMARSTGWSKVYVLPDNIGREATVA